MGLTYTDRSTIVAAMSRINTRQHIVDTASVLFHTHSYAEIGVATVCNQAGVSKGSFFHFFPSKRDLILAVMDHFREHIAGTLIAQAFAPSLPPLQRIDKFVEGLYVFQKAQYEEFGHLPGCPFGNLVMEQATQDEILRQKADGILRSLANHFRVAIADAVQGGELAAIDEEATAEAMLGYLEGIQLLAKARNDPELIRRLGPAVKSIRVPEET